MNDLQKAYRMAVILASALIASLFIYVAIVEIMRSQQDVFTGYLEGEIKQVLRYAFYGLAVLQVVIIRLIRGLLLRKTPQEKEVVLIPRILKASLFTQVLAEVPALFGLMLFFLCGMNVDFYVLTFVSLVLMFMFFPRFNNWKDWVGHNRSTSCGV
jgi:hypothetical protein